VLEETEVVLARLEAKGGCLEVAAVGEGPPEVVF
jgi:hypothetical protein